MASSVLTVTADTAGYENFQRIARFRLMRYPASYCPGFLSRCGDYFDRNIFRITLNSSELLRIL
jgi:hypothetical protein